MFRPSFLGNSHRLNLFSFSMAACAWHAASSLEGPAERVHGSFRQQQRKTINDKLDCILSFLKLSCAELPENSVLVVSGLQTKSGPNLSGHPCPTSLLPASPKPRAPYQPHPPPPCETGLRILAIGNCMETVITGSFIEPSPGHDRRMIHAGSQHLVDLLQPGLLGAQEP